MPLFQYSIYNLWNNREIRLNFRQFQRASGSKNIACFRWRSMFLRADVQFLTMFARLDSRPGIFLELTNFRLGNSRRDAALFNPLNVVSFMQKWRRARWRLFGSLGAKSDLFTQPWLPDDCKLPRKCITERSR